MYLFGRLNNFAINSMTMKEDSNIFIKDYKLYIAIAVAAIIMVLLYPSEGEFQYSYQKGRPWIYETLVAPFDFPVLKTQEQLMKETEEKATSEVDYYIYDDALGQNEIEQFNSAALNSSTTVDIDEKIIISISNSLNNIYSRGIVASFQDNDQDKVIFIKKGKRVTEYPATEVYDVRQALKTVSSDLAIQYGQINADSICYRLNLNAYIVPNLFYDKATSQLIHKESINYISPTSGMVYTGQLIVSKGEIVTAEIEQLLNSYKAEYISSFGYTGPGANRIISRFLIVISILLLFFITIYYTDISIFESKNRYSFVLMIFLLLFIATSIISGISSNLLFIVPFAIYVIYSMAFFKPSFVFPTYIIALLPVLIMTDNGVELFTMNAVAGGILLFSYKKFYRGWLQFLNAVFIFAALLVVYLAFNLYSGIVSNIDIIYLALNALLVVIGYPFIFLLERIFSLVSTSRLWEMTDTNNDLLQELSHKAPGTFQHSLQVANLAENAAREIGANTMLVRVGSLYHDIGKISNPQCFVENQAAGINYHKNLSPLESAKEIISHVDEGVTIAKKFHLPEIVIDFIKTHHGQSQTMYFYNVYCNNGGDPENKEPFTYNGELPRTKEQVIVMMADAVEAASRTLNNYTTESISTLVNTILKSRISDAQLINADISISEVNQVKDCFIKSLTQVYHERIAYPDRKK